MIRLVKQHAPITGEQIAEQLHLSRPTIRSDLALLVMLGHLDAKPKVGYFLGKAAASDYQGSRKLQGMKVRDVQSVPVILLETATVNDAVVALFMENVGTIMITDAEGTLRGMVSRKDLLKVTLGNANAAQMPVSLVMTRQPNLVTVSPDESVLDAARKMIHHQVDSLPVVASPDGSSRREVVGRITKTTMTRLLVELVADPDSL
ncbi:helix-turn-helix transcriptional regulator [Paenibacillus koleovorans]|uniref:helix-turn-helix transcriptional regulator n=1 Tax=Paenibacillus koleovorans TaxID=121608 RepID=UPI0013E34A23|nr:helix-turn-helix transcriptional regulator [Paenibacillus koleovorans]